MCYSGSRGDEKEGGVLRDFEKMESVGFSNQWNIEVLWEDLMIPIFQLEHLSR